MLEVKRHALSSELEVITLSKKGATMQHPSTLKYGQIVNGKYFSKCVLLFICIDFLGEYIPTKLPIDSAKARDIWHLGEHCKNISIEERKEFYPEPTGDINEDDAEEENDSTEIIPREVQNICGRVEYERIKFLVRLEQ